MELIHKPLSLSGPFRWVTQQRVNLAMAFLLGGMAGFWFGNGRTTQNAITEVSQQLGEQKKLVAKIGAHDSCETKRAEVAAVIANSADLDPSFIPNCPPPPSIKK